MKLSKNLKYGSAAVAFTAVFVAAVIILNVIAGVLTERLSLKADMTTGQYLAVSDEFKELAKGLAFKVNIYVLADEEDVRVNLGKSDRAYGNEVVELLKKYTTNSGGNISLSFVNIAKNPSFPKKYEGGPKLYEGDIIVEGNGSYRVMKYDEVYYLNIDSSSSQSTVVGLSLERQIASKIIQLKLNKSLSAAVLQGKNETVSESFIMMLTNAGFEITAINLAQQEVPDNVSLLVISAPKSDYTEQELLRLDAYFNRGGNAIIAMSPFSKRLPGFELYLKEWGVVFDQAVVCDTEQSMGGALQYVAAQATSHKLVKDFDNVNNLIIFPASMPITIVDEKPGGKYRKVAQGLVSSGTSYARSAGEESANETSASYAKKAGDKEGPFNLAVFAEDLHYINDVEVTNKVLFLGTNSVISDGALSTDSYGNYEFISGVLADYAGIPDTSIYRAVKIGANEMIILGSQQTPILIFVIALPLAILAMGVVIWYRRKNR